MAVLRTNSGVKCGACLFAVALAVNIALAWFWISGVRHLPTGDEGHYLMISRSLLEDRDLDLQRDYSDTGRVLRTFGAQVPDSHCWQTPHGWYSLHYPGIAAIVAIPYEVFGIAGARGTICFLSAFLIVLLFRILRRYLEDTAWTAVLAGLFYFGLLYLPASNQIYPDLTAGIFLLAAADVRVRIFRKIPVDGREFAIIIVLLAILPWLHMKYLIPVAIIMAPMLWEALTQPDRIPRNASACIVVGFSVAALIVYNVHCFHAVSGPLEAFSLARFGPVVMVYAGLLFDQAQGLFVQQPLYLLGVPGLAALWREHRRSFLWLMLLYHSILIPNVTHPNLYGGYSFAGRYLWSCSPLWIYPAACLLAYLRAVAPAVLKPGLALTALYQIVLACEWIPSPKLLLSTAMDSAATRNTLFGGNLRYALPSFYDPQLYAGEAANLLAAAGCAALAVTGFLLLRKRYAAVKALGMAYLACLAVFSPGMPSREYARDLETAWAQRVNSWGKRDRFEVESLYIPAGSPDNVIHDAAASGGRARHVTADPSQSGKETFFFFGPYTTVPAGSYAADFYLRADAVNTPEQVALLDIHSMTLGTLATLSISGTDFRTAGGYQPFRMKFKLNRLLKDVEFRCRQYHRVGLTADRVELVRLPDEP